MKEKVRLLWGLPAIALLLIPLAGCLSGEKQFDEVRVQLKWKHHAQFAGLYVADAKGFYADENVKADLIDLDPAHEAEEVVDWVSEGIADFGVVAAEEVLTGRDRGESIVAIAVIFETNPIVYASLKDSGISSPYDFPGKIIMASPHARIQHYALLSNLGMDPNLARVVPYQPGLEYLASGKIDIQMMYRSGTAIDFEQAGYDLNYIWPGDYGILSYGDVIIANEETIQSDPGLVEKFLEATLRGWRYAVAHQGEAVDITLQYAPALDREVQLEVMKTQAPLVQSGRFPVGEMQDSIWQSMFEVLQDAGILTRLTGPDEAFTAQFVAQIFGAGRLE